MLPPRIATRRGLIVSSDLRRIREVAQVVSDTVASSIL